jgi:hypothetical protein
MRIMFELVEVLSLAALTLELPSGGKVRCKWLSSIFPSGERNCIPAPRRYILANARQKRGPGAWPIPYVLHAHENL